MLTWRKSKIGNLTWTVKMYERLAALALRDFPDMVTHYSIIGRRATAPLKLRLFVRDSTFVDIWLSPDLQRCAYHWEQRAVRGLLHRHDNAPDHPEIATFPKHFHNGSEDAIEPSYSAANPADALREFLAFVRLRLQQDN